MSAFYNENDPKAAAWLRELISAGHVAPGIVDERSIAEISPSELYEYTQCHFFAGIGGWSLALRLAGWPDSRPVWTGSCPCQPFSVAGKQLGTADARHLWPVFFGLISAGNPPAIFGEQVASAAIFGSAARPSKRRAAKPAGPVWLDGVFADLESAQYACGAADLPAACVQSPHIRQRAWWVAYANLPIGNERARIGQQSVHLEDGRPSGLADSESNDRRPELQSRESSANGRRGFAGDSAACGMEHAACYGREQRRARPDGRGASGRCGDGAFGLGDADRAGCGEQRGSFAIPQELAAAELRGDVGAWSGFDIIPCLDGKARRVESGTFPLAHGVPGRVGLLRGYGNAIVPQLAAEFIQAAEEARANLTTHRPNLTP